MITHLAMNSHPDPKSVLVIGGGDGGVLREVVKHSTVETAILCDIDESVIRLSKKYLPGMSIGFQHPNVSTHVGDGFKYLADKKNEFDVIITDSSDPEGPAESLFQKPYFELLYGALKEGGVITTQGCPSSSFCKLCFRDTHTNSLSPLRIQANPYFPPPLQRRTNGSTSPSLPTSRNPAKKSSRRSNTPTPPSPPTLRARLASWSAAKIATETSRPPCGAGMRKKRISCVGTIIRQFIRRALCCRRLRGRR